MGFVVPSSVRFPVTLYAVPPICSTRVLRKEMVGYFFTAKKAVERRWVSRKRLCVSILAASTSASTQELAGFCSSICSWPRILLKLPLVVVTDMTRIANDTCEWVGSISQNMVILLEKRLLRKCFYLILLLIG